jgi:hypothetical protein
LSLCRHNLHYRRYKRVDRGEECER